MSTAPKAMPIYPGLIGKVAVVTGASSGIGAETARYFAANVVPIAVTTTSRRWQVQADGDRGGTT